MENSTYIGLGRQITLRNATDIMANNIANMNTTGFRAQMPVFRTYLSQAGQDRIAFVQDYGQYQETREGSMRRTGNPLDVALSGPGFLGVMGADGQMAYTRGGQFGRAVDGTLVTMAGLSVASDGGGTITIPADAQDVKIDERGVISTAGGEIGRLMIAEFDNVQGLIPIGQNLYAIGTARATSAQATRAMGGMVESSNVEPISEMTHMVDVLRTYQSIQGLIQSENDRMRSAIQKLIGRG